MNYSRAWYKDFKRQKTLSDDGVTLTYVFKYDNRNIEEGCASVKYFGLEKFIQHINTQGPKHE